MNLSALIDSGCSFPLVISKNALPRNTTINYFAAKEFTVANGNKEKTLGTTNLTLMHNNREIISAPAHVMESAPESLIIGFPLICKLNMRICHDHIEATCQGHMVKIGYNNNQITLSIGTPMTIKPSQFMYLKVKQQLGEGDVIISSSNAEHLLANQVSNSVGYTNTSTSDQVLYSGMIIANMIEDYESIPPSLDISACIDETVPKPYYAMFKQLIKDYAPIMSKLPGKYRGETRMSIEMTSGNTFKSKVVPIPFAAKDHYKEWVKKMTQLGVLKESASEYTSTQLVVKKKEEGQFRYVLNCSGINSITKLDFFPIPKLIDIMRQMAEFKLYIVCDVSKYFDSLPLAETCQKYFSFICPMTQQIYSFTTVVQGSRNASFHSQKVLRNEVLSGIDGCVSFIDDIICFGDTYREIFDIFRLVLQRFKEYNLHLQPQKLNIGASKVNIFGYEVSHGKIRGEASRIEAVTSMPYPKNKKALFKVMGSLGYYRIITPNYANNCSELNKMLSLNVKFDLTNTIKLAFDKLKDAVRNSIAISLPHKDGTFILNTDASEDSFGSTLASRDNTDTADVRIIGLEGGSFLPSQRRYNIGVKELLALSRGLNRFRHFLLGNPFIVKIDNSSLYHILKSPDRIIIEKTGPVSRVLLELQEFTFEPVLVRTDDISHVLADMISRGTYLKVQKVTAKNLLEPEEMESISAINYFPVILSQGQLWEIIKRCYQSEEIHSRTAEKHSKMRGYKNYRTHCEIAGAIIVPEKIIKSILELTHICSAKRHMWFLKSKKIWIRGMAEKVSEFSLECERCQKFIIKPIHEKFVADRLNGDYPFQVLSVDFSIIKDFGKGILIFTCPNSRFTFATLSKLTSSKIAIAIMGCMLRFGIAGTIIKLDNQFNTVIIKQMAELMQIKLEFSTPRNSRSNSLAELAVKKVQRYLRFIAPNFDDEDEVDFAVQLACLLINTEIREDVALTPLEIVLPHASFTPFALETVNYELHPSWNEYVKYVTQRLRGVYDIGKTDDIVKERVKQNQPLHCDDLVRIKLENTERANKLAPFYSNRIYRVTKVNTVTNTYVIVRVGTESTGQRSQRFLYHRRRLKKVIQPNERLVKFWETFPNSNDPISILKEAMRNGTFEIGDESTQDNSQINNRDETLETQGAAAQAENDDNDSITHPVDAENRQHQMSLRKRRVPNYENLVRKTN